MAVVGAALGASILASALLVSASLAMSRLRYASYVAASVAVESKIRKDT